MERIRSKRTKGLVLAGIAAAFFLSIQATGDQRRTGIQASARPARSAQASRQVVSFRNEKTDSWLCQNVSVFFCPSQPKMTSAPATASPNGKKRGRE